MRSFKVNLVSTLKCEVQLESDFPISINQVKEVLSRTKIKFDSRDLVCLGKKFYETPGLEREELIDKGLYTLGLYHTEGKYYFRVFSKSLKKEIVEIVQLLFFLFFS